MLKYYCLLLIKAFYSNLTIYWKKLGRTMNDKSLFISSSRHRIIIITAIKSISIESVLLTVLLHRDSIITGVGKTLSAHRWTITRIERVNLSCRFGIFQGWMIRSINYMYVDWYVFICEHGSNLVCVSLSQSKCESFLH